MVRASDDSNPGENYLLYRAIMLQHHHSDEKGKTAIPAASAFKEHIMYRLIAVVLIFAALVNDHCLTRSVTPEELS